MAHPFETATAVHPDGDGVFAGSVDEGWWIARAPHGGYLAALVLRALTAAVGDPARAVRSYTIHFIAPAKPGAITLATNVERIGRRLTQVSARAEQDGSPVALALGAYSTAWPAGLEFDDAPMPEVRPPEDGIRIPADAEGMPPFLRHVDISGVLGARPFSGAGDSTLGAWMRLREPLPADAHVVTMLSDALAPAVWPRATAPVVTPTIDLTVHFRAPLPAEGARADDFVLGRFTSSLARDGFFEEDGELWTPDGRLIAQSRQLALVIPAAGP